jgi:hypothetical protein
VLRCLSNLSAHAAITTYCQKRLVHAMYGKLAVALVALLAAVIATAFAAGGDTLAFWSAVVSTVVACFWGLQYVALSSPRMANPPSEPAPTYHSPDD